jgi:hypothetical protein
VARSAISVLAVTSACTFAPPAAEPIDLAPPGPIHRPPGCPPTAPVMLVASPTNGQLFTGMTANIAIPVSGVYQVCPDDSPSMHVQIVDATAGGAWTTVGTATVQSDGQFATTIGPFAAAQWPQGAELALRVVDDNGVPLAYQLDNDATLSNTTIVVGSPNEPPASWAYLTEQRGGSASQTAAYYKQIAAPKTLAAFQTTWIGSGSATAARFYNKGDLGVGRDLTCAATPVGGVACTVAELGAFDRDESAALADLPAGVVPPSETFAIVYDPVGSAATAVQFMVYDGSGNLADAAKLDTTGDNTSVPQACLNCHGAGGTAHLLQLDPLAMDFDEPAPGLGFVAQQGAIFELDQLIASASATTTATQVVDGEWRIQGGDLAFNADFIPTAWLSSPRDATLYRQVIAPFCRGCHATIADGSDGLSFATPADVVANGAAILGEVCGSGSVGMPEAQATAARFFAGITPGCNEAACTPASDPPVPPMSARALLLEYLGASSAAATCGRTRD